MSLLETSEEVFCYACQPNAPDPPVVVRLLTHDEAGANKVVNESTRRRPGSVDRRG
jgi:hypothetical protein